MCILAHAGIFYLIYSLTDNKKLFYSIYSKILLLRAITWNNLQTKSLLSRYRKFTLRFYLEHTLLSIQRLSLKRIHAWISGSAFGIVFSSFPFLVKTDEKQLETCGNETRVKLKRKLAFAKIIEYTALSDLNKIHVYFAEKQRYNFSSLSRKASRHYLIAESEDFQGKEMTKDILKKFWNKKKVNILIYISLLLFYNKCILCICVKIIHDVTWHNP